MENLRVCYYNRDMPKHSTNKLKCIITGRQLIATKNYYTRKVEKAGGEEKLHSTYVCREAKNLLKQGLSIDRIRELLDSDLTTDVPQLVLEHVLNDEKITKLRRINNIINTKNAINTKTDPKVKKFINNIIK